MPKSLYCVTDGMVKLFVDPNRFVPKLYTNEHVLVAAADLLRPKKVRLPAASVYPRLRPLIARGAGMRARSGVRTM